jgi:hypothetical protein
MYEAKRRVKGLFVTLNGLEVEPVGFASAADADALTAEIFG